MSVHLTRLDNGLRVVSENRPQLQTVSVGVWVDVGSRHESPELNGITHCLEHMLFKGTTHRSARDIACEIEAVGGYLNAYTSREHTTYYARVLKDDLSLAIDILSDILLNSVFEEKELQREKEVIIQEIGQTQDTPDDVIFDYLQEACFKGQPLGRSILGTTETVRSYTRADLHDYLIHNYTAANMVVSAVGNVDHTELLKIVEQKFAGLRPGERHQPDQAVYTKDQYFDTRKLEQAHVTLAWPSCSFHDARYYPMQLYSMILGGGMSSRLFQEIRENRGLAYSVYSFVNCYRESGVLGVYAATGPELAEDMVSVILSEMKTLKEGISDSEFATASAQLKAGLMMGLEATSSRMEQLGRQLLVFDRIIPMDEIITNIESVAISDIQLIAEQVLEGGLMSVAAIGGKKPFHFTV